MIKTIVRQAEVRLDPDVDRRFGQAFDNGSAKELAEASRHDSLVGGFELSRRPPTRRDDRITLVRIRISVETGIERCGANPIDRVGLANGAAADRRYRFDARYNAATRAGRT